jgi:hypothetical protein
MEEVRKVLLLPKPTLILSELETVWEVSDCFSEMDDEAGAEVMLPTEEIEVDTVRLLLVRVTSEEVGIVEEKKSPVEKRVLEAGTRVVVAGGATVIVKTCCCTRVLNLPAW